MAQTKTLLDIDTKIFWTGDGPVTRFVATYRIFEMVAQGQLTADEATNWMYENVWLYGLPYETDTNLHIQKEA